MDNAENIERLLVELSKNVTSEHNVLKRLEIHEKECIEGNKELTKSIEKLVTKVEVLSTSLNSFAQDDKVSEMTTKIAIIEARQTFIVRILAGAGLVVGTALSGIFMHLFEVF